jgi:hypothetical protein
MELYILDDGLARSQVITTYKSMIWTERFNDIGDLELVISPENAPEELQVGTFLFLDESDRIMRVKRIETFDDEQGGSLVKVLGESIEAIMKDRPNVVFEMTYYLPPSITGGDPIDPFVLPTNPPADVMRNLFSAICENNLINPEDNIPGINTGGPVVWDGMMPEPSDPVDIRVEVGSLFDTLKNIADVYQLGFGIFRTNEVGGIAFGVWPGRDCTTAQTDRDPIIFGDDFIQLGQSSSIKSAEEYKNVAYVYSPAGTYIAYESSYAAHAEGFERRVLLVDASDIDLAAPDLDAALEQRGLEELAKHNILLGFDGSVPTDVNYKYRSDYYLGDLVEERGKNGVVNILRVSEQIFAVDETGENSYPTFTIQETLTPDVWGAVSSSKVWDDYDLEVWDDL